MNQKAYILKTSRSSIKIDADELPEVLNCLQGGKICVVRQGIFNPSFFVEITEDTERIKHWQEKMKSVEFVNKEYGEKEGLKELPKLCLENIFDNTEIKKLN